MAARDGYCVCYCEKWKCYIVLYELGIFVFCKKRVCCAQNACYELLHVTCTLSIMNGKCVYRFGKCVFLSIRTFRVYTVASIIIKTLFKQAQLSPIRLTQSLGRLTLNPTFMRSTPPVFIYIIYICSCFVF
jgi:hypothetical protein